ncbi:MAG: damage-inducible protein DinB [Treponema sp.]|jgi:uncharacterized damage-inducible protein DinB|nr:damage-inducible protein DinB [Treponema sp.]
MKETAMYAKYNQAGNRVIYDLLSKMSNEEREKDRGSYYGSLSALFRHVIWGTRLFLGVYKEALVNNTAALKAIAGAEKFPMPPEGILSTDQWKKLDATLKAADAAYVGMAEAVSAAELAQPLKIDWYGGKPPSVPLSFMLSQLLVHNTHHRGQISQILDSLKIDNNYSGINVTFL